MKRIPTKSVFERGMLGTVENIEDCDYFDGLRRGFWRGFLRATLIVGGLALLILLAVLTEPVPV